MDKDGTTYRNTPWETEQIAALSRGSVYLFESVSCVGIDGFKTRQKKMNEKSDKQD